MAEAVRTIVSEADAMTALAGGDLRYAEYACDIAEAGRHLLGVMASATPADSARTTTHERLDLADLVERACAMVALRAADKRITLVPPAGSPTAALGHTQSILQILVNLLTNAVKFTPEGGCVMVAVTTVNSRVMLDVIDDGPGVPFDHADRVFADFERTLASDGVGLGLPISRDLARAMGGDLHLIQSDTGACFRLTLAAV